MLQGNQDVTQSLAIGIVTVHRQLRRCEPRQQDFEQALHAAGSAAAYGIAQRYLVAAHGQQLRADRCHRLRGDLALVRAAQHTGDVAPHGQAVFTGGGHHRGEALQAVGDAAIDVFLRERLRGGREYGDLIDTGGHSAFKTLQVGCQRGIAHAGAADYPGEHGLAVRHLRNPLGIDEAAGLYHGVPGAAQVVDQLQFCRQRNGL